MTGLISCLLGFLFATSSCLSAAEPTPEQAEFFETKIRPIFVDRCYSCHSDKAKKLKGGLRLDTRAGLIKGGTSGAIITPGDPGASLLIKAVRYEDKDLQMPPEGEKLQAEQIEAFVAWVKMGAPDPRTSGGPMPMANVNAARARHWAFQPVTKPALPPVKNSRWIQTPVDNFILAKLEPKKIKPSVAADRRTLIRRVTYDLLGLPPTPGEVEAFIQDKRPGAYAQLVDRLLASPRYGERWGRHWLDVARYADTKGYLAGGEERRFPFSHTYRDYVIRAFNEDKPYDQFLIEQIAADRLPSGEDKSSLAALGFLTLGRRFLNNQNDIIDDRIDVVTRGTLGLTVTCARCHDHKFDPISTKDYYALHGVFASSEEPSERPLLGPLRDSPEYQDYRKQRADIEKEIAEFEDKEIEIFLNDRRQQVGDYLMAAHDAARLPDPSKFDTLAGEHKTLPALLRRWMTDLDARQKTHDPIFSPWFELSAVPEGEFATNAATLLAKFSSESNRVNSVVIKALSNAPPASLRQSADVYTRLFKDTDSEWTAALTSAIKEKKAAPAQLPDVDREELRKFLYAEGSPANPPKSEVRTLHARRLSEGAAPMRNRIEALNWTHTGAPLRAMALVDQAQPHDSHVAKRGNPANPGEVVLRRFIEVLGGTQRGPFTNGSGRLELAQAIASHDNPLTARVYVNRVWQQHFGDGFVSTAGDFGVRTEAPLHRDLLDYLAAYFMENGWSTKKLHRLIVLSATYQQSSAAAADTLKTDPDNRFFAHMNRQRLDFESLRDTLLAVSGKLDLKMGGAAVDVVSEPFSPRRTVYGLIDRQNLPGLFRTFDFANPDTSNQGRFHTTVPQQALFMMNSPFVIEEARSLIQLHKVNQAKDRRTQIQTIYQCLFQRPASDYEIRWGEKFLASQTKTSASLSPLEKYAQVLLLSNELVFID